MVLLRAKLIAPGEKRETSTKTCNETMLRDKLRVFVSRISPPLGPDYMSRAGPVSRAASLYWDDFQPDITTGEPAR